MAISYPNQANPYTAYIVALPEDSRIPPRHRGDEGGTPAPRGSLGRPCEPDFDRPRNAEEGLAWFRWVVGHQHLFLYWMVEAEVCQRASRALRAGDADRAARWLGLATALRWGEIAAMLNCGSLPTELYQAFLRPKMEAVRADFSARSAQDYLALEGALEALRKDLSTFRDQPAHVAKARQAFRQSCTHWRQHHIEVAERLQPGVSLAVREYQRLREEGIGMSFPQYVDRVIQSKEVMAVYDRFFGIERVRMGLEEFAETTVRTLGQAHRMLALPREQLKWVLRGDHLLVAFLDGLLRREPTAKSA